jgi:hypothetical protein
MRAAIKDPEVRMPERAIFMLSLLALMENFMPRPAGRVEAFSGVRPRSLSDDVE